MANRFIGSFQEEQLLAGPKILSQQELFSLNKSEQKLTLGPYIAVLEE
jgi:hypothetical protein